MKIKTLVVGLGNIGMMYNFKKKKSFSNHCSAVTNNLNFDLIGAVETKSFKRNLFKKKFKLPCFANLSSAFIHTNPELIIISVPTNRMDSIFKIIIKKKIIPKIILLEKPGSFSYKNLFKFVDFCKLKKIKLMINYNRMYSKKINKIEKYLNFKFIGSLSEIKIIYHKGFYNSCSHYINFLQLFYKISDVNNIVIHKIKKIKKDYLVDCKFKSKSKYTFKLEVSKNQDEKIIFIGTKGKIVYLTEKNKIFFKSSSKYIDIENDFHKEQENVLKEVYKFLTNKIFIDISFPLNTLKILNKIIVNKKF
jgi:hypothetical protein